MRNVVLLCFALLLSYVIQAQQLSGNYTIDKNNPTLNRNFNTFLEASLALKAGVTGPVVFDVVANSGPYNEQLGIDTVIGSSATNTVTFKGNGNELFFSTTNASNRAGVRLDGADWVIIDSLTIRVESHTAIEFGYGVQIMRNADNNIIRKCTIINPLYPEDPQNNEGIVISAADDVNEQGFAFCDNNIITQNSIIGGYHGVVLASALYQEPYQFINNTQITNNIIKDFYSEGIGCTFASGTLIDGNDISGRITDRTPAGISLGDYNEKAIIRNNRIHGLHDDPVGTNDKTFVGITIGASPTQVGRENQIYNNLLYDWNTTSEQTGIRAWIGSTGINIYHNTISLEGTNAAATSFTLALQLDGGSRINFINNIVTINRVGSVSNKALDISGVTGFVSDRNNIWIGTNGNSQNFGSLSGTHATLGAWQLATTQDYHSVSLYPAYANLAAGDLTPTDSAIDNMGAYVNINSDINGAVRNNTHPDVGAIEFLTPPCTPPILGGDMKVLPGLVVCESSGVTLNLENNTFGSGQTYTWQSSATETGAYADISNPLVFPAHDISPVQTMYYRAALACGATTVYSDTILITVTPRLPSGTYTINKGAATGGSNFQSFNDALNAMRCGIRGAVVFNVVNNSGPYNEQLLINAIPGTSATNTITFNGNGNVLTYLSTNTNERANIKLINADYITFDSLSIEVQGAASGQYGFGIQLLNDADNNTIKRCTITMNNTSNATDFAGIVIGGRRNDAANLSDPSFCDSNTVTRNTIIGGYYGINCLSDPNDSMTYKNNITYNNIKDFRSYGIYGMGMVNSLIEGNDISRPTRTNTNVDFNGIYLVRGNRNVLISKNRIHNTNDGNKTTTNNLYGIYFSSTDAPANAPVIVSNNLIYNFNGAGVQAALYNTNSDNTKFYYNTVALEDSMATGVTRDTRCFYQTGDAVGIELKNNNFTINRATTGQRHVLYMNATATEFVTDYNNYYIKPMAGNANAFVIRVNGENFSTLADWQADSTLDDHSISMNPVYKDPINNNYTPDTIPFDNKGIAVGIATDILNNARSSSTPDIGAFEFTKCSSFPVVTVASDSINVCAGQPVTFTVTNPAAGTTYNWFNAATGGTQVSSGNSYTVNTVTAPVEYWVEGITTLGCRSVDRKHVEAASLAPLAAAPVLAIDSVGTRAVRFKWNAVAGATAYQVSRDGVNFSNPSSGATGLTHTITGLNPKDTVSLVVKALGVIECQSKVSARVLATTLENPYFIPNTFTPNGNGKNDVFRLTSTAIQSLRLMIFNQWGEKVFETSVLNQGWDGSFKGKQQPIGVYVYVAKIQLTDGTIDNVKGTFNLVR